MPATDAIRLPTLSAFGPGDEAAARCAFAAALPLALRQAWRAKPEEGFQPASVRVGVRDSALWILAELADRDIVDPPAAFNDPAFLKGDAFEMFFAPEGQPASFEFHITPGNVRLQLRFPQPGAARAAPRDAKDPLAPFKVEEPLFESWTTIAEERWSVLARVPLLSIVEKKNPFPAMGGGAVIRSSFCRYDWTRGRDQPVLSSTSPHPVCDFHRIEEWRPLAVC
jgi:hypothetical protein